MTSKSVAHRVGRYLASLGYTAYFGVCWAFGAAWDKITRRKRVQTLLGVVHPHE